MNRSTIVRGSALALTLLGGSLVGVEHAGAQDPPEMTVDPLAGLPGQTITVSGSDCFDNLVFIDGTAHVDLMSGGAGGTQVDTKETTATNGDWTVVLQVPANQPEGALDIIGDCRDITNAFDYAPSSYHVMPVVPPDPVPPGPVPPGPVPPDAVPTPAEAVVGTPRYAG